MNFKQVKWRDKKWLLHLRTESCIFTNSQETEACHVRFGTNSGLSTKPSDFCCLSLDYRLHREQHQHGEVSFYQKYVQEYPYVLMEMVLAFAKLKYLCWLVKNGRSKEAIEILGE